MKIAIDTGSLTSGHRIRGVGYYTRNLVESLSKVAKSNENVTIDAFDFRSEKNKLPSYNVIHYPYFDLFFLSLPFIKPTKIVVTVHDLIPLIYPNHYPPGIQGKVKFSIQKCLLRRADAIITDTETSKEDIIRLLNMPHDKVFPIHLAPAKYFKQIRKQKILTRAKNKYKLPNKFVLYVGDVNYNKNLSNLARACKITKTPLVIVGKQAVIENFDKDHPENKAWVTFLNKYKDASEIIRIGFVSDKELVAIYNLATVYCQPSLYEGFGLPLLEAMACGCPVVTSNTQALVEIGNQAAIFVNPKSAKDMSCGLKKVLENKTLQSRLREKGIKHSQRFSWVKTAQKTLEVYKKSLK